MDTRKVISADSHVIEPPTMWREYIDPAFRERAPHLERGPENDFFCVEGLPRSDVRVYSCAGAPPAEVRTWNRWDVEGRRKGGWDHEARVKDMATDGVDAEVLYATMAMSMFRIKDLACQRACFSAYNRWLADFCKADPKRYVGNAIVSTEDIDLAVKGLHEARKLGLRGVMLALVAKEDRPYSSPEYSPIWETAQELDIPLSLHNFTRADTRKGGPVRSHLEAFPSDPVEVQYCISNLIYSDVFERFPRLKIVSVENDIGWVANYLQRMDHVFHRYGPLTGKTFKSNLLPSEIFRQHVYLTFMDDMAGMRTYDLIGVDNVMWSSDYPHGDSTFPHSQEVISQQFAKVPAGDKKKILRDNVVHLHKW